MDQAFDNIKERSYRGTAPSPWVEGRWMQAAEGAYSTPKTSLTNSEQPWQPHGGLQSGHEGDLSLPHTVLAGCLPHPCLHLGPAAPPPLAKMGTQSRVTSWKSDGCLSLQRGLPRRGLLSVSGTGNYNSGQFPLPLCACPIYISFYCSFLKCL